MEDDNTKINPIGEELEETELVEQEENALQAIKKIKQKLKECEKEKSQNLEDLQRAKADFLNSKKRLEQFSERQIERTTNDHIEKLLPLCDSFQMAMSNKKVWESVDQTWRTGIESIYGQLQALLKQYNVEVINPLGKKFDPVLHEAMSSTEPEANKVTEVLQYGYSRNGELIRPAKVVLSN